MAFSLRHLFCFIAAASVAILVSTKSGTVQALLLTVGLGATLMFLFPNKMRRPVFYGGLAGMVACSVISSVVLHVVFINTPREPIISRRNPTRSGETQTPLVQQKITEEIAPFTITLGFVFGAATSFVVVRLNAEVGSSKG